MWRHKLDKVSSIAAENALVTLEDVAKILPRGFCLPDATIGKKMLFASDLLRQAGFVGPTVFCKEIDSAYSRPVLGRSDADILRRAVDVLTSYLKESLCAGVPPSLFFNQEAVVLSNATEKLPAPCGSYFAPVAFWDLNGDYTSGLSTRGLSALRRIYQGHILTYLRTGDQSRVAEIGRLFAELPTVDEEGIRYVFSRLLSAFFSAISHEDAFVSTEEKTLFSAIGILIFSDDRHYRSADPVFVSRLLHVVAKSSSEQVHVKDAQTLYRVDGLLSGISPQCDADERVLVF